MARLAALTLFVAGCATTSPAGGGGAPPPELQERAASLFDAATHGDELRLKTMVDWGRWRMLAGLDGAGEREAAELLSRIEVEPTPSARFVDGAVKSVRGKLADVAAGTLPPQARTHYMNATLAGWRREPTPGTPPSLARLQTLVADSLADAREVTYEGQRRVTLVFVGNRLAGVLDAR